MDRCDDSGRFQEFTRLVDDAIDHLHVAGRCDKTRRSYRRFWSDFLDWARATEGQETLPDLVTRYRSHLGIDSNVTGERPSLACCALNFLEDVGRHSCRRAANTSESPDCAACALDRLLAGATAEILRLDYGTSSRQKFSRIWKCFRIFAARTAPGKPFSQEIATRFLEYRGIPEDHRGMALRSSQIYTLLAMRILAEFAARGSCRRRTFRSRSIAIEPSHQDALDRFLEYCRSQLQLRPGTLRLRRQELSRFLEFLGSRGVGALNSLKAEDLSSFVITLADFSPATVSRIISDVRCFLRHLCVSGIVTAEVIEHLPRVRVPRDARIPSVWKREDVETLLASVDRASPIGKRDYAILLLACRLGLRVSDIKALHLEDIDWEQNLLRIAQKKTGIPLVLPLSNEVGEAIVDYLRNARPPSEHRIVFLKALPPFDPFRDANKLHGLVTFYRCRAGIHLPPRMRRGLHSLRHSLATRLLEVGTPFETISEIMGHQTMESTLLYTKVDISALQSVALDPDNFSEASDE